jgi:hypothetical protein
MSYIINGSNRFPIGVTPESLSEVTEQTPVSQQSTNTGIANTPDQFETAIFSEPIQQETSSQPIIESLLPADQTVEASVMFEHLPIFQELTKEEQKDVTGRLTDAFNEAHKANKAVERALKNSNETRRDDD